MDVRCHRCGTDYEFDDTLISDRGTTVQCTNCGYQFRIFPQGAAGSVPERWRVRTSAGKEHVYTSLRELQRAISDHKVGPKDLLSRGAEPPRALGSIPELEPFFATTAGVARGLQHVPRTLHGVAPPPSGAPRPPAGRTHMGIGGKVPVTSPSSSNPYSATLPVVPGSPAASSSLPTASPPSKAFEQRSSQPRVLGSTLPSQDPAGPAASPPRAKAPDPFIASARSATPSTTVRIEEKRGAAFDATHLAASPPRADPPLRDELPLRDAEFVDEPGPTPPLPSSKSGVVSPVRSQPRWSPPTPAPPPVSSRDRMPSFDDAAEPEHAEPGRRARSRWIAGVVFLAVAGLLAATVGSKYLSRFTNAKQPQASGKDQRAERFLAEGMRLLERSQYEEAREQLMKAQALADRDPGVLAGFAQVETLRAELYWLKLRLLDPTATALVKETERELTERVTKARRAVDAAFAAAPEDPTVVRARVNVLRVAGEEGKAREWIQPVAANPTDPQNAFVLAALDLAEAAPAWSTVIDRLRAAAVSGKDVGRARATLIYALVRAGRVVEAGTEVAKVESAEHPHPLLPELRAFVARFGAAVDAGADADADAAVLADAAAPATETAPSETGATDVGSASGVTTPGGDFRRRLTQAAQAVSFGDLVRAEQLYRSVASEQPGNTEALAGLADVARRRNDTATANRLYAEVLEANPSYLPALMATADQKWQAGDRKGAITLYRRILEQAGASSDYGQRAAARIAQGEGTDAAKPSAPSTTATSPAPTPKPESTIDTSDLPGVTPP